MSAFVAGTRIHAPEGLRPIESIKADDFVLAPDPGGNPIPVRVVGTSSHDDDVHFLGVHPADDLRDNDILVADAATAIWILRQIVEDDEDETCTVDAWRTVHEIDRQVLRFADDATWRPDLEVHRSAGFHMMRRTLHGLRLAGADGCFVGRLGLLVRGAA